MTEKRTSNVDRAHNNYLEASQELGKTARAREAEIVSCHAAMTAESYEFGIPYTPPTVFHLESEVIGAFDPGQMLYLSREAVGVSSILYISVSGFTNPTLK